MISALIQQHLLPLTRLVVLSLFACQQNLMKSFEGLQVWLVMTVIWITMRI